MNVIHRKRHLIISGLVMLFAARFCLSPAEPATAAPHETVVLLHGLNRTHRAMGKLERSLRAEGYAVINCDYPSRSADIDTLTATLFAALIPQVKSAANVHFVTHSMGGVLLRNYLQTHDISNLGRVVMLGPPNRGSEVVDRLGSMKPFRWINGPAGCQLGTGAGSLPLRLEAPSFEFGVIAGDRSVNPVLSMLIPGRDDGKVSVARAQTAGMHDLIRLHVTHPFMMRNSQVIRETQHYLRTGQFQKAKNGGQMAQHLLKSNKEVTR